jgi:hypothetical protein
MLLHTEPGNHKKTAKYDHAFQGNDSPKSGFRVLSGASVIAGGEKAAEVAVDEDTVGGSILRGCQRAENIFCNSAI